MPACTCVYQRVFIEDIFERGAFEDFGKGGGWRVEGELREGGGTHPASLRLRLASVRDMSVCVCARGVCA